MKNSVLDDTNILIGPRASEYKDLVESSKILVDDPLLYKLGLLIVLTTPLNTARKDQDLSNLCMKYRTLMSRRLSWMASIKNLDSVHSQVFSQLDKLSQITRLVQNL